MIPNDPMNAQTQRELETDSDDIEEAEVDDDFETDQALEADLLPDEEPNIEGG